MFTNNKQSTGIPNIMTIDELKHDINFYKHPFIWIEIRKNNDLENDETFHLKFHSISEETNTIFFDTPLGKIGLCIANYRKTWQAWTWHRTPLNNEKWK